MQLISLYLVQVDFAISQLKRKERKKTALYFSAVFSPNSKQKHTTSPRMIHKTDQRVNTRAPPCVMTA